MIIQKTRFSSVRLSLIPENITSFRKAPRLLLLLFFPLIYIVMESIFTRMTRLCTPSAIYFSISILILLCIFFQNLNSTNNYKVGIYSKNDANIMLIFLVKFIYIVFWTYVLNLFCKDGNQALSWLLVLFPFILSFVILGTYLLIPISQIMNPFEVIR